jgi:hypothetical protein
MRINELRAKTISLVELTPASRVVIAHLFGLDPDKVSIYRDSAGKFYLTLEDNRG